MLRTAHWEHEHVVYAQTQANAHDKRGQTAVHQNCSCVTPTNNMDCQDRSMRACWKGKQVPTPPLSPTKQLTCSLRRYEPLLKSPTRCCRAMSPRK